MATAVDHVLQQLPAARDEAQDVVSQLRAERVKQGEPKVRAVQERMAALPVPRSTISEQAFTAVVAFNRRWRELGLDGVAVQTSGADAGPLGDMAARVQARGALLKRSVIMLEQIDRARLELGLLQGRVDAGQPVALDGSTR